MDIHPAYPAASTLRREIAATSLEIEAAATNAKIRNILETACKQMRALDLDAPSMAMGYDLGDIVSTIETDLIPRDNHATRKMLREWAMDRARDVA